MKDDKVTVKLDKETGKKMLEEELQNIHPMAIHRLMNLYNKYEYPRPDAPMRMWDNRQAMNCPDIDPTEKLREKIFKERLEELKKIQKDLTVEEIQRIYKLKKEDVNND